MQTIVITGSTRGIGLGLAREFLRGGHNVVVTGRSQAAVDRALADLAGGDRVLGLTCDVRSMAAQQAVWDQACAKFGRVDVWINNAAIATDRALLADLPVDQIEQTVATNLLGTLYGCKVAIAGMLKQPEGGKVYTFEGFGSDGIARPGLSTYGSTKRAIRYLTASLAKEYKDTKVLVGSLSPGIVATDLLLYSSKGDDPAAWEKAKRTLNILGDTVETVCPYLAREALAATKQGAMIAWLTPRKAAGRFLMSFFKKRDILSELEARPDLTVR
jgi:NAD(P)-dependent dehydrogenase (short-subunit alcohol dehydrogenase family)